MARGYSAYGTPNAAGTSKTMAAVINSSSVRARIFDAVFGTPITPADQAWICSINRFTTTGTNSSFTPNPLDVGDVAAVATAGTAHSAEPGYAAASDLVHVPLNQRASFRWVASPGYELMSSATAQFGIGIRIMSATASLTAEATLFWFE